MPTIKFDVQEPDPETSNDPLIQRFYALRPHLELDPLDLDTAYAEILPYLQDAADLATEADAVEMTARHSYDIIKAEAAQRLRSVAIAGKEPSEARIDRLLPLEPDVQDARVTHDRARHIAAICNSLYRTFETKSRLLPKISDRQMSTYSTRTAAYDLDRREIREARVEHERAREAPGGVHHVIGRPTR